MTFQLCLHTAAARSFTHLFVYTRPLWMKSWKSIWETQLLFWRCPSLTPHDRCCDSDKHRNSESLEPDRRRVCPRDVDGQAEWNSQMTHGAGVQRQGGTMSASQGDGGKGSERVVGWGRTVEHPGGLQVGTFS